MRQLAFFIIFIFANIGNAGAFTFPYTSTENNYYAGGNGSEGNPYRLKTVAHLKKINRNPQANFILENDIDLAGEENPFTYYRNFTGHFDGNNKVIKNFTTNRKRVTNSGLFGYLGENAVVENLGLVNVEINGDKNVGCIANKTSESSRISNSYCTGIVKGYKNIGGLVGANYGEISNSYSAIDVYGEINVGGLVGANYGKISNSYSASKVFQAEASGGFIGYNDGVQTGNYFLNLNKTKAIGHDISLTKILVEALSLSQMKNKSSFKNFDFNNNWNKRPDVFPTIKEMKTSPIILGLKDAKVNSWYKDVIKIIPMGLESIEKEEVIEKPNGMKIKNGVITWMPTKPGDYTVKIRLYSISGVFDYKLNIRVHFKYGRGTVSNPYQIYSVNDLNNIRYSLDKNYILKRNLNFANTKFSKSKSKEGWLPIGYKDDTTKIAERFLGSFDGNNLKIKNLYINRPNMKEVGLFAATRNNRNYSMMSEHDRSNMWKTTNPDSIKANYAFLKNLNVINFDITGGKYVGVIAGLNDSYIINVHVDGLIKGDSLIGGLTGRNDGIIVKSSAKGKVNGIIDVGGLAGVNSDRILSSYNFSDVKAVSRVGGLTGSSWDVIDGSYNAGVVTGDSIVGGLVGYNSNVIQKSYNNSFVRAKVYVGGLVGKNSGAIINNYSAGNIKGELYVGGIVGLNKKKKKRKSYEANSFHSLHAKSEKKSEGIDLSSILSGKKFSSDFLKINEEVKVERAISEGLSALRNAIKETTIIYNNYSVANVAAEKESAKGIVGTNLSVDIMNSFYKISPTTRILNVSDKNKNAGKSQEELSDKNTFNNWNFDSTWIAPKKNSLPYLQKTLNLPIVLNKTHAVLNTVFKDTIKLIKTNNSVVSFRVLKLPKGMSFKNKIITWKPKKTGFYPVKILVKDNLGNRLLHSYEILVSRFIGSGVENNPYQIKTIDDLNDVRLYNDKHFILMNDLDFKKSKFGKSKKGKGWKPIEMFTGSFDGNNKVIKNLYINRPDSSTIGLFGIINKAKIKNLSLINSKVIGGDLVGSIAGLANNSDIFNCSNTGDVVGISFVGGLVGFLGRYRDGLLDFFGKYPHYNIYPNNGYSRRPKYSSIFRSYNVGTIKGAICVGGLVGSLNHAKMTQSYSNSNVYAYKGAGGLVGYIKGEVGYHGKISESYSAGQVIADYDLAGGIASFSCHADIDNTYTIAFVHSSGLYGAILGEAYNYDGKITNNIYNIDAMFFDGGEAIGDFGDHVEVDNNKGYTVEEMKKPEIYSNLGFYEEIWKYEPTKKFPLLKNIKNNYPIIVYNGRYDFSVGKEYRIKIDVIPMGAPIKEILLEHGPADMKIVNDTLVWIPSKIGENNLEIVAEDQSGLLTNLSMTFRVNDFKINKENLIEIRTVEQLDSIRYYPKGNYILMNDLDFSNTKFDSANGSGWTPIKFFKGSLDGNNHVIKNLYINRPDGAFIYGLQFGGVKNLGLENCLVEQGKSCLASYSSNSNIDNCYATGRIDTEKSARNVGFLVGKGKKTEITNSYVLGEIKAYKYSDWFGLVAGGLSDSKVMDCYSNGEISGGKVLGGIVGRATNTVIQRCNSNVNISRGHTAGGILGTCNGRKCKIIDCYTSGNIDGVQSGGIYGTDVVVHNCYTIANVSGKYSEAIGVSNCFKKIGTVTNSYYASDFTSVKAAYKCINHQKEENERFERTAAELTKKENYKGWNFDSIWVQNDSINLPQLRSILKIKQKIKAKQDSFSLVKKENNNSQSSLEKENNDFHSPKIVDNLIISKIRTNTKVYEEYCDTIDIIKMGNNLKSISLIEAPARMKIEKNIIRWTPKKIGKYSVDILIVDNNNLKKYVKFTLNVTTYDGYGTEDNPFKVFTIEDLNGIRNFPKSHFILINNLDFKDYDYSLINKVNGKGWLPIDGGFMGHFDGNDKVIKNIVIETGANKGSGLFSFLASGSVIENLGMINAFVKIDNENTSNVGILAGFSNKAVIKNCYTNGFVDGFKKVGGLIGYSYKESKIYNSYSNAVVYGNVSVGGLIGKSERSFITNAYTSGFVGGSYRIGGIIGNSVGDTISNSYTNNYIQGGSLTGNFVGKSNQWTRIERSYFDFDVSKTSPFIERQYEDVQKKFKGLPTPEMKQRVGRGYGWNWDYQKDWERTYDKTFARLQNVQDLPVFISQKTRVANVNQEYREKIRIVAMDEKIKSIKLISNLDGMTFENNEFFVWTPKEASSYLIKFEVEDINGLKSFIGFILNVNY